jgi:hypothetical protein
MSYLAHTKLKLNSRTSMALQHTPQIHVWFTVGKTKNQFLLSPGRRLSWQVYYTSFWMTQRRTAQYAYRDTLQYHNWLQTDPPGSLECLKISQRVVWTEQQWPAALSRHYKKLPNVPTMRRSSIVLGFAYWSKRKIKDKKVKGLKWPRGWVEV